MLVEDDDNDRGYYGEENLRPDHKQDRARGREDVPEEDCPVLRVVLDHSERLSGQVTPRALSANALWQIQMQIQQTNSRIRVFVFVVRVRRSSLSLRK